MSMRGTERLKSFRLRAVTLFRCSLLLILPLVPSVARGVYSCGGTNDDFNCGADNPYPCCSNGGNCTWWAWEQACRNWVQGLPNWGNALSWLGNAPGSGWPTGSTPQVGSIACDTGNGPFGSLGHVAWVTGFDSNNVTVTEQWCDGFYGNRTATYSRSSFEGYIYKKGGGTPPTPTPNPCGGTDNATYVSDSWPHDGDDLSPNQSFQKSWTMRNSGSSTWKNSCNHKWAFDGGQQFGAPEYTDVGGDVSPGNNKTWTLNMTAPSTPGTYTGYWKTDRNGVGRFGDSVWITIDVINPKPDTPNPSIQWLDQGMNTGDNQKVKVDCGMPSRANQLYYDMSGGGTDDYGWTGDTSYTDTGVSDEQTVQVNCQAYSSSTGLYSDWSGWRSVGVGDRTQPDSPSPQAPTWDDQGANSGDNQKVTSNVPLPSGASQIQHRLYRSDGTQLQ